MTEKQKQAREQMILQVKEVLHKLEQGEAEFLIGVGARHDSDGKISVFPALIGGLFINEKPRILAQLVEQIHQFKTPNKIIKPTD